MQIGAHLTEETYFNEWKQAKTVEEREHIWSKCQALNDLQFTVINSIRGNKDE